MFGLAGRGLDMQHPVWSACVHVVQGCLQLGALAPWQFGNGLVVSN